MALKLIIQVSKKIPGPTDFSSVQASVSIEGELSPHQDPVVESQRLYAQAESAVNRQLGLISVNRSTPSQAPLPSSPPQAYQQPVRRAPALITAAQLQLIEQLLQASGIHSTVILSRYRIASLNSMTCKAASALIDELKGQPAHQL